MQALTRAQHALYMAIKGAGKISDTGMSIKLYRDDFDLNSGTRPEDIREMAREGILDYQGNSATREIYWVSISWAEWLHYQNYVEGHYKD